MSRTVNALLLRGAAHHERDAVFLHWDGERWVGTPDWRADRHTIRIALALRERYDVGPSAAVEIATSLRPELPLIERAVWGLGAVSSVNSGPPVVRFADAADASASVPVIAFDDGSYDALLEQGGVLDTPERATEFRARAREVPEGAMASRDGSESWSQEKWVDAIDGFLETLPSGARTLVLPSKDATRKARVALYAGWSEGRVTLAFGGAGDDGAGSLPAGSVTLSLDYG